MTEKLDTIKELSEDTPLECFSDCEKILSVIKEKSEQGLRKCNYIIDFEDMSMTPILMTGSAIYLQCYKILKERENKASKLLLAIMNYLKISKANLKISNISYYQSYYKWHHTIQIEW